MILCGAVVLGLTIWFGTGRAVAGVAVLLMFLFVPVVAVMVVVVLAAAIIVRRAMRPKAREDDEALLAELAALGLTAGLTFPAAVEAATAAVPGQVAAKVRRAGRLHRDPERTPPDDPGLLLVARRALATGAPLLPAVSGYAAALRSEERCRQLNAARRLPVKLLFPLALLILPGFLILTIGPAVLGSLERLGL